MLDLEQTRTHLEGRRTELEDRLAAINRDLRQRSEPVAADFAEQATEQENVDVLYALEREGREELTLVQHALRRIEGGNYAECNRCGGAIAEARLKALPYTETCIGCAA